jgi:hypothetical protein
MASLRRRRTNDKCGGGLLTSIANKAVDTVGTIVNRAVDLLPIEAHLPGGYQFCGPGTKLKQRLERGDRGINPLDAACRQHDIAYFNFKDSKNRALADRILAEKAWSRVKASDAGLGERAAAWAVTNIMKVKSKFGGGKVKKGGGKRRKKTKNCTKCGKGLYLRHFKKTGGGVTKKSKKKKKVRQQRK